MRSGGGFRLPMACIAAMANDAFATHERRNYPNLPAGGVTV